MVVVEKDRGVVGTRNNLSAKDVARAYDKVFSNFERHRLDEDNDFWLVNWPYLEEILSRRVSGASILDVGTGPGLVAERLLGMGASRVVGIDTSRKMIVEGAKRRASEKFQPIFMNATQIGFASNEFDLVLASYVLDHIMPLETACEQMFRVVRPGGIVVALEPNDRRFMEYFKEVDPHAIDFTDGVIVEETWPGTGGESVPVIYRHDAVIDEHFEQAGFVKATKNGPVEPLPSQKLRNTHPDIYERYLDGELQLIPRSRIYVYLKPYT